MVRGVDFDSARIFRDAISTESPPWRVLLLNDLVSTEIEIEDFLADYEVHARPGERPTESFTVTSSDYWKITRLEYDAEGNVIGAEEVTLPQPD
jgi:hypothetical protein